MVAAHDDQTTVTTTLDKADQVMTDATNVDESKETISGPDGASAALHADNPERDGKSGTIAQRKPEVATLSSSGKPDAPKGEQLIDLSTPPQVTAAEGSRQTATRRDLYTG